MLYRWFAAWKKFYGKLKRQPQAGLLLNSEQTQAYIDLQACMLIRGNELKRQFPEVSFLLQVLGGDGFNWEWFPNKIRILHDLKTYPYNYQIVSHDVGVDLETAYIQLISPGLRHKNSRDAIVKAKVSIYNIKTTDEIVSLISDLNEV